jgi:hypothetical protein
MEELQGERRSGEGLDGDPYEDERVVVAGDAVQVHLATAGAAVDERPLAVAPDVDGDRFHGRVAVGLPVTGHVVVDVAAPEAGRAVVAVGGAGRVQRDVEPAVHAPEGAATISRSGQRRTPRVTWRAGDAAPGDSAEGIPWDQGRVGGAAEDARAIVVLVTFPPALVDPPAGSVGAVEQAGYWMSKIFSRTA